MKDSGIKPSGWAGTSQVNAPPCWMMFWVNVITCSVLKRGGVRPHRLPPPRCNPSERARALQP